MELFGVLKEILLQRKKEAKEMAEKCASNFVLSRKTKQEFKFLLLVLDALSLVKQPHLLQHLSQQQNQISAQPAVSSRK